RWSERRTHNPLVPGSRPGGPTTPCRSRGESDDAPSSSSMKEHLERLIALQEADLRLEEIAERKRRIPEMVEAVRQPLLTAQATRDSLKQEVDKLTKDRKSCEQALAEQEQAISKLQDRITKGEIKTNREYQAHLVEIVFDKKKKGENEKQLLSLMTRWV